jgi:hypothetical protein
MEAVILAAQLLGGLLGLGLAVIHSFDALGREQGAYPS